MGQRTRIYFRQDQSSVSGQIDINAMGIHERMPPGLIRHGGPGSGFPFLFMVFHSPAFVYVSGQPAPARGHVILWDQEASHHYGHPNQPWDHTWLHLRGEWPRGTFRQGIIPLDQPLKLQDISPLLRHLRLLHDELHRHPLQDPAMIEAIVSLLWLELRRACSGRSSTASDPRLEAARRFIELFYDRPFDLDRAAAEACLSRSHFCTRFARQYGVAPGQYAMRLRLHRAAHLLMNADLAVFQVARMVGYEDSLYFSRLFRKRHGVSPAAYRQRHYAGSEPSQRPKGPTGAEAR